MSLTTWAMLLLTAVATVTDVRRQKIYNWTTYPGILLGLLLLLGCARLKPFAQQ